MTLAMFRVMLLGLLRDRGALATSFLLPVVFFVVFAEISTSSTGQDLKVSVALVDESGTAESSRLVDVLTRSKRLELVPSEDVGQMVRRGRVDAGIVLRRDPGTAVEDGVSPILIVADPARPVAVQVLMGEIQRVYLTEMQRRFAGGESGSNASVADDPRGGIDPRRPFGNLIEVQHAAGNAADHNPAAYYAGAIAFMFLLFASVHGAISLHEERDSGLLDRILAGPSGIDALIDGKFAYLLVQGCVQASLIFLVAWVVYGVDLLGNLGAWAGVTLVAVVSASGLALVLVTSCSTRRQAQAVANIAILIISAVGGSMVPRFLMPETLQNIGWLTPNTWALEAYAGVFWRDEPLSVIATPAAMLLLTGIAGLLVARALARRRAVRW